MGLRDVTRAIIAQVERASGYPVLVTEDRSLRTFAAVQFARGNAPAHTITYNPSVTTQPDYLIAYQCGFILRLFVVPPSERCDFAPAAHGREIVHRLLSEPEGPGRKLGLQPQILEQLRDQLFAGLMVQLRSIPVGLRVDAWILREHQELAALQRSAVLRQLQDGQATLAPDVRKIAPSKVYKASVTMNAAFALFWCRTWDDPALSLPYKAAGYDKPGARFLSIFNEISDEPIADRQLIDAWAGELSLSSWYEWVPSSARSAG
jgi:hypothetical protein